MKTSIVKIGNSQGIRIPKVLLEASGFTTTNVELKIEKGSIRIVPIREDVKAAVTPELLAAESSLAKDWNRPEEDAAWASLQ